MRIVSFAILAVLCGKSAATEQRHDEDHRDTVIFDRAVGAGGQRLVVVRGPDIDPSVFEFLNDPAARQVATMYEIRVEIRKPGDRPLCIATSLHWNNALTPLLDQGVAVLDATAEGGVIAVAMTDGPILTVWRIQVFGAPPIGTGWIRLNEPWNDYAAPYALDTNVVGATLGHTDDGRLTIEVVDKRRQSPLKHTRYEQVGKSELRVKRVRQWEEVVR